MQGSPLPPLNATRYALDINCMCCGSTTIAREIQTTTRITAVVHRTRLGASEITHGRVYRTTWWKCVLVLHTNFPEDKLDFRIFPQTVPALLTTTIQIAKNSANTRPCDLADNKLEVAE